jgi:hypothetical protein
MKMPSKVWVLAPQGAADLGEHVQGVLVAGVMERP